MSERHYIRKFSTEYLKSVWDKMGDDDGIYGEFVVQDAGHTVNGLFMDDVHAEMNRRGEGKYVAV